MISVNGKNWNGDIEVVVMKVDTRFFEVREVCSRVTHILEFYGPGGQNNQIEKKIESKTLFISNCVLLNLNMK